MDLIHRKEKYNEYLKKIEKAKSDEDGDYHYYEALEDRADIILTDLKEQNDKMEMNIALSIIAIPILMLSIYSYVNQGFSFMLIALFLLIIFLIYYRFEMIKAAKMVRAYRIANRDKVSARDINWLKKKIEYITYGIEVKLIRLRLVKIFYLFFFPTMLVFLAYNIFDSVPFSNRFISFFVAFLIGGVFWHYFFHSEIEDLEDMQEELERKMHLLD